jgi:hypothetical protein
MELLTRTLDLEDEVDVVENNVEELEEQIDERVERALDVDPPEDDEEAALLDSLEEEVAELDATLVGTRGYEEALTRAINQWDGSEIVLRELSGAETRAIKARAQQKADEAGVDYTDDFHETEFLKKAVESTPPGAPEPSEIGDLPDRLFDWLLTRANMLNSVGEFNMGNSSLRERMIEKKETRVENSNTEKASQAPETTPT